MPNRKEAQRLNWIRLEDKKVYVCGQCVQEPFLNEQKIDVLYLPRVCIGCGKTVERAFALSDLAERCRTKLPQYFEVDDGVYEGYGMSLAQVLSKALTCTNTVVLKTLAGLLESEYGEGDRDDDSESESKSESEDFFSKFQEYQRQRSPFEDEEDERRYVLGDWRSAAKRLTHGRRFFNRQAETLFDGVVAEAMSAEALSMSAAHPAIKILPPNSEFFRARIAQSLDEQEAFCKNPAKSLGAPPKEKATNGRMSAAGIPSLYLSGDPKTCVAEVRPSIGDDVVVGRFRSMRELTLFDLTAFSKGVNYPALSYFDPSYNEREMYRGLLSHLHVELGRPVKLYETDYLMTQALAEFIRFYRDGLFDGIAFQSVQNANGVNYTLFDSSTLDEQHHRDWEPKFDVQIDAPAEVVVIRAVQYVTNPQDPFK